ncbi:LysR family transcriptional regulator [Shewanella sp. 1_MG-2023]|uniref:LysR family transcriptional regulator n=1 Tax=unclassified Shewanella TaxID=196818 RepID=UPI0026E361EF|nr:MULTISPECIES: LysR family transcriptional regulator [unclassified Shewanella]MDO6611877.1 LysR family transcriptional regulator [Shewanella sp. 7_MG-2023]MDO6771732.1 LysR family transcriptional regulator [Shewanella sp. 2_MG-2023]MDO6793958.1 LysR family transcriptional regulator [Shewanella sp. 1_MG-2023]
MDTDLLKTYLEVYRTRHFGKAADNLFLTRSAVSFRVKQLENMLGVSLFNRERNNIQPTPAGERLLEHANAVLTAVERAKQDVSLSDSQLVQLSLGIGHNVWDSYLNKLMQPLCSGLQDVSLRTDVITTAVMSKQLSERTLDIALSFDPLRIDDIEITKLHRVNLILVADKSDLSVNDISQYQYVKVDWGTAFNIMHAQELAYFPMASLHTSSAQIAFDYLMSNGGSAFLPETMVEEKLLQSELFLVEGVEPMRRHIYAAHWINSERIDEIEQALLVLTHKIYR